jgi:nicotinate-nucleotide pyrophosphorylase (carboxylating)
MQLSTDILRPILDQSLKEDFGINGDITSNAVIDHLAEVKFSISSRENIILCGADIAQYFFKKYSTIEYKLHIKDSQAAAKGDIIISGQGKARDILMLERVILNYLQMLSGISTLTHQYVTAIKGTQARICDTRKTTPNLRALQKYAVRCGGGYNHRSSLDSAILIKDNHISICGGVTKAIRGAKLANPHYTKIEIECDTLAQVKEAIEEGVDIIMLDNMSIGEIKEAIQIINNRAIIEVSGGVNLENIRDIAKTGVDIISVGRLTHSAPAVDIGLDMA